MSDVGDNNFVRYIYRGEADEEVPEDTTHITVHEDVKVVLRYAFCYHQNIIEIICHDKVERIEQEAFVHCISLRRVIMPGVKVVERGAFLDCYDLTDVECGKLKTVNAEAFRGCKSLRSINLPSARDVILGAFNFCDATDVKFGNELERIEGAFDYCSSLERITIPFKDGLMLTDNTFQRCVALKHVDLIEGALHETIAALQMEDWRDDMNEEIDSINQKLPNTSSRRWNINHQGEGGKAGAIRRWIRAVLGKIVHYKVEHQRLMDEAGTTLELILPAEIVRNNVRPFLALPSYTFDGEDEEDDGDGD